LGTNTRSALEQFFNRPLILFRYDRIAGHVLDVVEEYSGLREPSCPIPGCASTVRGITHRLVRGLRLYCPRIRAMLRQADLSWHAVRLLIAVSWSV
jgi:hypothetical protein